MSVSMKGSSNSIGEVSLKRKNCLTKYVTIFQWLPKYTKFQLISDFIAGITLGLTMIPQSIAYAALAGLTAQYGLYSSFLGGFIYAIFGTIKEVGPIGPTSLMALLTMEYTRDMPVDFVFLLTFLAGCVELIMGMLNLGFLVDFISIPVTSGFTSATSVIIIISQLQGLLGLKFKSHNIVDNLMKLFRNLPNIRVPDTVLGCSCVAFLLLLRKSRDLEIPSLKNRKFYGKLKKFLWLLSISRNALTVLIASIISFHLNSSDQASFILSGKVEAGLPKISLPPFSYHSENQTYTFFEMCSELRSGIIIVPLIAVLANVAIAKAFASGAAVNATQEMLTLGLCNVFGSFISSMPTCGAFTRSAVATASGVQTPFAGIYSGIMTLLALSFLTPYFYFIPRATLASVLISAVVFMIDWKIITILWKGSKRDAVAAIGTFLVSVLFSVEVGLLFGVISNVIYLLYLPARPKIDVQELKTSSETKYLLLKPDTGFFYPAVDFLCNQIKEIAEKKGERKLPIIVDCDGFKGIDYTAVKGFERLLREFRQRQQKLLLLNVTENIVSTIHYFGNLDHFHITENIADDLGDDQKNEENFKESTIITVQEKNDKLIPLKEIRSVQCSATGEEESLINRDNKEVLLNQENKGTNVENLAAENIEYSHKEN